MSSLRFFLLCAATANLLFGQRVTRISSSRPHHSGVRSNLGRVQGWGLNATRQLADTSGIGFRNRAIYNPFSFRVVGVAAGAHFSLMLTANGVVGSFGNDLLGQLGDGSGPASGTCAGVPCSERRNVTLTNGATLNDAVAIAAGSTHALAVRADGTVLAWGTNTVGEIGNPAVSGTQHSAVNVAGVGGVGLLNGVIAVAAGESFSLALRHDGTVVAWGDDAFGQLGRGATPSSTNIPVQVKGIGGVGVLTDVVAIAAGRHHSLALRSDGSLVTWGRNQAGQLGTGTIGDNRNVPVQILAARGLPFTRLIAVAGGAQHSLALRSDGTVLAWGSDSDGQLGNGDSVGNSSTPRAVVTSTGKGALANIVSIAAGSVHSVAVAVDGTVSSWGANNDGLLGDGSAVPRQRPVPVLDDNTGLALVGALAVSAGSTHSLVVTANGAESSAAASLQATQPVYRSQCIFNSDACSVIAAAGHQTEFLGFADGTMRGAGSNTSGQLGIGSTTNAAVFTPLKAPGGSSNLTNVLAVSAGLLHGLALRADGTVVSWGSNNSFALGTGTANGVFSTPANVVGPDGGGLLTDIVAIAAGHRHSVALRADGAVFAWGANNFGEVGVATPGVTKQTPTQVLAPLGSGFLTGIVAIAAGDDLTVALRSDGAVFSWGKDTAGQLGDGPGSPETCFEGPCASRPRPVAGLTGVIQISARGQHVLALKQDGTVVAWGADDRGQLGNNSTFTNESSPVTVMNAAGTAPLSPVTAVDAGYNHSVALRASQIFSWGDNSQGQLSDGSSINRPLPVPRITTNDGLLATPAYLAAGGQFTLYLLGYEFDL